MIWNSTIWASCDKIHLPATQNDFRNVAEHVWMPRSATPATRNEATTRLKPPKRTTSAKLPIGTAIRSSYGRLRTVALVNATSSEHTLNPQTPRVKREPLLRIREKPTIFCVQKGPKISNMSKTFAPPPSCCWSPLLRDTKERGGEVLVTKQMMKIYGTMGIYGNYPLISINMMATRSYIMIYNDI